MEIGVCGGPREWQMLARYRYDYCEGVLAWLASLDEDGFADAKRARAESGLDVACFNGLIPGGFDLYGTEPGDLRAYLSRAFSRAAELGGRIAVLGSVRPTCPGGNGKSRGAGTLCGYHIPVR